MYQGLYKQEDAGGACRSTVTFESVELEDRTIELQRLQSLALHHAIEHDPQDTDDISRLAFVTEMLADKVGEFALWLVANGQSNTGRGRA